MLDSGQGPDITIKRPAKDHLANQPATDSINQSFSYLQASE